MRGKTRLGNWLSSHRNEEQSQAKTKFQRYGIMMGGLDREGKRKGRWRGQIAFLFLG